MPSKRDPNTPTLFKLTDEDKRRLGERLARKVRDLELLEAEKADVVKDFNDRIKAMQEEIGKLADTLNQGSSSAPLDDDGEAAEARA
jgi:hypothetical protein